MNVDNCTFIDDELRTVYNLHSTSYSVAHVCFTSIITKARF